MNLIVTFCGSIMPCGGRHLRGGVLACFLRFLAEKYSAYLSCAQSSSLERKARLTLTYS